MKNFISTLSIFCKNYHNNFSYDTLIENLSFKNNILDDKFSNMNDLDLDLIFKKLEDTTNLNISIRDTDITDINILDLPCIAILKDDSFCIINEIIDSNNIKVITSKNNKNLIQTINIEKFKTIFINKIILLKENYSNKSINNSTFDISKDNWLKETLLKSKKLYIDVIMASILINLFVLASPLFTMSVYDRVIPNNATDTLWVFAIGVIIVYFIDASLKFIRSYFLELAAKKSDIIISSLLYDKILNIKKEDTPSSTGIFVNHIKGFDLIRGLITSATLTLLIDLPFSILFLLLIWYIAGTIVLIPILIILFILLFTIIINPLLQKSIEKTHLLHSFKNSILIETISNLELFKTFGKTQWLRYKWQSNNNELANQSLKSRLIASFNTNITGLFIQLNIVLIVIYGVYQINDNFMTMGALIATIILGSRVIAPMGQISALISSYNDAYIAYKRLDEIMKTPDEKEKAKQYIQIKNPFDIDIEFKNVCFRYKNTNNNILTNINFKINKNEKVAILGNIGSGKTTILKLILKIYEPTSGSILFNGIDIHQINPINIRKNISYISQESSLFSGTLRENISMHDNKHSDEKLLKFAQITNIHNFIKLSEKGLDMPIFENGVNLSGGQKQCISISREFAKECKIMLFDEPTSALDNSNEKILLDNLKENIINKTAIFITQKYNILELVDRIIVIQNGEIYLNDKSEIVIKKLS